MKAKTMLIESIRVSIAFGIGLFMGGVGMGLVALMIYGVSDRIFARVFTGKWTGTIEDLGRKHL